MRMVSWGAAIVAIASLAPGGAWAGSNQEVAQEIASRLGASGQLGDFDINVKFEKGAATLRGRVPGKDQMFQAISIAQGVTGVTKVVNEMEVVASAAPVAPPVAAVEAPAPVRPVQFAEMPADVPQAPVAAPFAPMAAPAPMARPTATPVRTARNVRRQEPAAVQAEYEGAPQMQGGSPIPIGGPIPAYAPGMNGMHAPARYDQPHMPCHAWPSYAAYPNYGAVTYPRQYSPTAWPYIGPFYPYPQVPLGWRKVTLEWDDGWWMLDFDD